MLNNLQIPYSSGDKEISKMSAKTVIVNIKENNKEYLSSLDLAVKYSVLTST